MSDVERNANPVEIVDGVHDIPCPCGGTVHAGFNMAGEGLVIHSLPYCAEFERLEPDQFMVWRREEFERRGSV